MSVSIHAPREGCDLWDMCDLPLTQRFQFTHPGRGATADQSCSVEVVNVSIHAPREGCDIILNQLRLKWRVSIHAPREGCDLRQ